MARSCQQPRFQISTKGKISQSCPSSLRRLPNIVGASADVKGMSIRDYAAIGRLGNRACLDPPVPAAMMRPTDEPAARRSGLRRLGRVRGDAESSASVAVQLVDYSMTGIGFTTPPDVSLQINEVWMLRLDSSDTKVRVVSSHQVDGLTVWGAMFLDPQPALPRTIEEVVLHMDRSGEEARWNAKRH